MFDALLSVSAGASLTSPVTLLFIGQIASLWQSLLLFRRRGTDGPQLTPLVTTAILAATWQLLWTGALEPLIESAELPAHLVAAAGVCLSIATLAIALTQAMAACRRFAV